MLRPLTRGMNGLLIRKKRLLNAVVTIVWFYIQFYNFLMLFLLGFFADVFLRQHFCSCDLIHALFIPSRIVISISAWKSCHETDAQSLFNIFCSSLHEMLHLATTSQL